MCDRNLLQAKIIQRRFPNRPQGKSNPLGGFGHCTTPVAGRDLRRLQDFEALIRVSMQRFSHGTPHEQSPRIFPVLGRKLFHRSYDFGGTLPGPCSGCSWLALGPRISVASSSVTTITPGTGSSTISTTTVSTFGITLFATACFLILVARFFDFAFVLLGLASFRRKVLVDLRAFPRVALPLPADARFFRLAMTVTYARVAQFLAYQSARSTYGQGGVCPSAAAPITEVLILRAVTTGPLQSV